MGGVPNGAVPDIESWKSPAEPPSSLVGSEAAELYSREMAEYETFKNAPITEAVLEFQLRLQGDAHLGRMALVQDEIAGQYPQRKDSRFVSAGIQVPSAAAPWTSVETKQVGYTFTSPDGKQIVHARINAFGFSRLRPYPSWKDFRGEAQRLWGHFRKVALPERITRVGLRYINRIELPLPVTEFKDYILTKPDIAPGLPSAVSTYALQMVIHDPSSGCGVTIHQTIDPVGTVSKTLPLIFDIDAFKPVDLPADSPEAWTLVEQLRTLKNEVFFKSLTEKAKERFR